MKTSALKFFDDKDFARPPLKWVGGKGQLLPTISDLYPIKLKASGIKRYIEPFIGGGAVFFDISNKFNVFENFLFDINPELVILYNVIKNDVDSLISELEILQKVYNSLDRERLFYFLRDKYNQYDKGVDTNKYSRDFIGRAALTVFLNKTCYNGLYRVNSHGMFNVPMGRYDNPTICDADNLHAASSALQNAIIKCADFSESLQFAGKDAFIYYDPPYRPISATASFKSYSKSGFNDADQARLSDVFAKADFAGAMQMLSNSDPTNHDTNDLFFDNLYSGYNIHRVSARRAVNSDASKRGEVRELIITNYES
ncbi:MAG: DNA adenine methylase [Alphaproteobacteria bacterium]|nr:DNA adenine methylase [Alphaproteobacteria bacterium]MCL2890020.1 DNA adenine methylase [Alphaproteobacteria bacterium]